MTTVTSPPSLHSVDDRCAGVPHRPGGGGEPGPGGAGQGPGLVSREQESAEETQVQSGVPGQTLLLFDDGLRRIVSGPSAGVSGDGEGRPETGGCEACQEVSQYR